MLERLYANADSLFGRVQEAPSNAAIEILANGGYNDAVQFSDEENIGLGGDVKIEDDTP